jgi:hypothetical protein
MPINEMQGAVSGTLSRLLRMVIYDNGATGLNVPYLLTGRLDTSRIC